MRILLVHCAYLERGGEDSVFEAERELLRAQGHEVVEHRVTNERVREMGRLKLAARAMFGVGARRSLARIVRDNGIEVAHFHNTQPLVSPAAFAVARRAGAAVVHSLHNYRLACPSATLFRDGGVCTECVGRRFALPAIRHACYRGSRAASAVVATTTAVHRVLGTWRNDVDAYIALTGFQRDLLVRAGLPRERVALVPNFLARDPGAAVGGARSSVLFVGRLAEEKGVRVLLAAARQLPAGLCVRFVGTGPLGGEVASAAATDPRVVAVGVKNPAGVLEEMRRAAVLVVPSLWFEGMPMTVVEAFASGLPVIASRIGGLESLVTPGRDGALATPNDAAELARVITTTVSDRRRLLELSSGARETFARRFTAAAHHEALRCVYAAAIASRRDGSPLGLPPHLLEDASVAPAPRVDAPSTSR